MIRQACQSSMSGCSRSMQMFFYCAWLISANASVLLCFSPTLPHENGADARQFKITSCHVLWLWRRGGGQRSRPGQEDGPACKVESSERRDERQENREGKRLSRLTRSQTPCGRRGTYCSLEQRRRGRRRSRLWTRIWAGTAYGPPCPTGRPKKRLRTSSPDTRCCLERGRQEGHGEETLTAIWSQMFISETAEWIKRSTVQKMSCSSASLKQNSEENWAKETSSTYDKCFHI